MSIIVNLPIINILVLFLAGLIVILARNKKITRWITSLTLLYTTMSSIITLKYILGSNPIKYSVGHFSTPWGIEIYVGNIEAIFTIIFSLIGMLISVYSFYSITDEIKEKKYNLYFGVILILIAALIGIVYSFDLFNAFVFIEISSIASITIILVKDKKENLKASLKYLVLSSLGSGLFLMSIAFIYSISGHLNMRLIHQTIATQGVEYSNLTAIAMGLLIVGIGVKAALFPLHVWLPDAHSSAPTPSSAMLSGLVLKAYALLIIKILIIVFGENLLLENRLLLNGLAILAVMGMIIGSVLAIMQKNIKKVIAYSTVAQMGYVFLGISLGTLPGLRVAIYHMINHSIIKSMIFLTVGSMAVKIGSKDIKEFRGIGKEMPYTLGLFTLGAMSMVGIPPLPGFISKFKFAMAIIDKGNYLLIVVILISSLLNGLYYFPIIINGFFGEDNLVDKKAMSKIIGYSQLVPLCILALLAIAVGIGSTKIFSILTQGLNEYINLI